MQRTLKLFKKSRIIKKHTILEYKSSSKAQYLKAKVELINNSQIFVKEYISSTEHLYSYHWQDAKGNLIIRWDNSPHHKSIKTFPHHKHSPELEESNETNFSDIIKIIKKIIKKEKE